jgi:uncharacterized protein (UPF0548 family)
VFFLRKPTKSQIAAFIEGQKGLPFSYPEVGGSRVGGPPGYDADRYRTLLGRGEATFRAAVDALKRWEMFNVGWLELESRGQSPAVGATIAILARPLGLWSLNASRVIYVLNEDGETTRWGFAYGTLPEHAECGEERFLVEWHRKDDSVWYDLFAFSRPNSLLVRLGYLYARRLQRRFARDSTAAMTRATARP